MTRKRKRIKIVDWETLAEDVTGDGENQGIDEDHPYLMVMSTENWCGYITIEGPEAFAAQLEDDLLHPEMRCEDYRVYNRFGEEVNVTTELKVTCTFEEGP